MFSFSIKQLLRTPMKSFLFIFLLACVTMLMVFGSVLLVQTDTHISQVESTFTTIGMVEQKPSSTRTVIYEDGCGNIETATYDVYDELLTLDVLNFEGADYIQPPEDRRCYLAKAYTNLDYKYSVGFKDWDDYDRRFTIAEMTALEDSQSGKPVKARIDQVLLGSNLVGNEINFCPHHYGPLPVLKKGEKFIACMKMETCKKHGAEFVPVSVPYTSLYDEGLPVTDGEFPGFHLFRQDESNRWIRCREFAGSAADMETVDLFFQTKDDNYSLGAWVDWANSIRNEYEYYPVIATNSLTLMPSFQSKNAQIADGRAITQEEFESGAMVCLVPDSWNKANNDFAPGEYSGLVLPISITLQGYPVGKFNISGVGGYYRPYSIINEKGWRFSTFSQGCYTIVGTYTVKNKSFFASGDTELADNTVIIPARSVTPPNSNVVYRGPLSSSNVSFQISNGSIASFDKKLRETVPEAELLNITYHDNGYEDIMPSLERTRTTAILLCSVGTAGAVAVIIFLLYFFIARERRRTAIERGLGMTKRQCYISLISGVLALALLGTVLGSGLGLLLTDTMQQETEINHEGMYAMYSTRYSDWTNKWNQVTDTPEMVEEKVPWEVFSFAIPAFLLTFIFLMSMLLVAINLRIEPIELLGGK